MSEGVELRSMRLADLDDPERCVHVYGFMLRCLGEFIGSPLASMIPLEDVPGNGRVMPVRSTAAAAGALRLEFAGVVAPVEVEGQQGIEFGATLFLYTDQKRVTLQTGESFFDVVYRSDGRGWVLLGWFKDVYGEWEHFERL